MSASGSGCLGQGVRHSGALGSWPAPPLTLTCGTLQAAGGGELCGGVKSCRRGCSAGRQQPSGEQEKRCLTLIGLPAPVHGAHAKLELPLRDGALAGAARGAAVLGVCRRAGGEPASGSGGRAAQALGGCPCPFSHSLPRPVQAAGQAGSQSCCCSQCRQAGAWMGGCLRAWCMPGMKLACLCTMVAPSGMNRGAKM